MTIRPGYDFQTDTHKDRRQEQRRKAVFRRSDDARRRIHDDRRTKERRQKNNYAQAYYRWQVEGVENGVVTIRGGRRFRPR